jgi:uncharacterized membrane protein YgcG
MALSRKFAFLLVGTLNLFCSSLVWAAPDETPGGDNAVAQEMPNIYNSLKYDGSKGRQNVVKCKEAAELADKACLTTLSPVIQNGVLLVNGVMAATSGLVNACSKYQDAMNTAKMVMTAYEAACSAAKVRCEYLCKKPTEPLDHAVASCVPEYGLPKSTDGNDQSSCANTQNRSISDEQALLTKGVAHCEHYGYLLLAAGTNAIQYMMQSDAAKDCQDKTESKTASTQEVDCSKSENSQVLQCICEAQPRSPGCPGAVAGLNSTNGVASTDLGNSKEAAPRGAGAQIDLSKDPKLAGGGTDNKAGLGGAPSGGGGSGGGGGGKGGADGSKGGTKSALNTNILSGDQGGGGGGRSGGGSYDDSASPYHAYKPGGSKDPNRGLASATKVEVTGAGGLDNFKKVSERYKDAKSSLMGQ